MNYEDFEKNTIFEYWKTLIRKNILSIPNNKFLKKPYSENYIINMSDVTDDSILLNKIFKLINNNDINNEDIILFLNSNFEWSNSDEKKYMEQYFLEGEFEEEIYSKITVQTLLYQVKYFRLYFLISELLFDLDEENNELYYFIFLFIRNNKNDIRIYLKKNFKFKLFHYYINQLFDCYLNLFNLLYEHDFIETKYKEREIYNLFLKNIFLNWYNIYKNDIMENKLTEKIKEYQFKKSFLSKILCLPNV